MVHRPPRARPDDRSVDHSPHARARSVKTTGAVLMSVGAVLVVYGLVIAFAVRPPALGWLGFAIVLIIVLGLAALVPLAFERTRVSAPRHTGATAAREPRLLVIADSHCSEVTLRDEILARLSGAVAVHLVVPVRVSRLHFLTDDESDDEREAEQSMRISVGLLQQRGVSTTGSVGSDKPLESMIDALAGFPGTRVLLVTPPEEDAYWLERDLLAKARRLISIPVTQVVVPSSPADASTAEQWGAARV